jgi:hypothetical protein
MSTAQTIINRAFRLVTGSTDALSTTDTANGLEALNNLLQSLRNSGLTTYSKDKLTLPIVANTAAYTVGPTGDLVTTRPISIDNAYQRVGSIDYLINIHGQLEYDRIKDKLTTGDLVHILAYNPTAPDGTVTVWPVPTANTSIYLTVTSPLAVLTAGTTLTLPPGWERMLGANLAVEIAPEYGFEVTPTIAAIARSSLTEIKRANVKRVKLQSGLTELLGTNQGVSNIFIGP